jgi:hypothetical protein
LGLHGIASPHGSSAWGGPPCELLVAEDSPHLIEIARALAAHLSRPGHEVRVSTRPARAISRRRSSGRFSLLLGFARQIGKEPRDTLFALLTAASRTLASRPPRLHSYAPRRIAQTLTLGVVGEVKIEGGHLRRFRGIDAWDLGAVWRR